MTVARLVKLYDQDFYAWIESTIQHLKSGDLSELDLESLIEEMDALGKREKRELENRLITLFEHALKRQYVALPDCYRGWELTIRRTQNEITKILRDSPSLKNFIQEIYLNCYQEALENMQIEYDTAFPKYYPFAEETEKLLTSTFQ